MQFILDNSKKILRPRAEDFLSGSLLLGFNDVPRADLGAVTALNALGGINRGQIIRNGDGPDRALTLALHAADTAHVTLFHHSRALILGGAGGHDLLCVGDQPNDIFRAGLGAGTAADALFMVGFRHAVDDMHGVKFAGLYAVAVANAGKEAVLIASVAENHGGLAVMRAVVIKAFGSHTVLA